MFDHPLQEGALSTENCTELIQDVVDHYIECADKVIDDYNRTATENQVKFVKYWKPKIIKNPSPDIEFMSSSSHSSYRTLNTQPPLYALDQCAKIAPTRIAHTDCRWMNDTFLEAIQSKENAFQDLTDQIEDRNDDIKVSLHDLQRAKVSDWYADFFLITAPIFMSIQTVMLGIYAECSIRIRTINEISTKADS